GKATRFEFFSERMERFFDLEVFNPTKGIVAILISDITDRRNTEKALLESEDKFKYIFDYSAVGKSITLPTGEIHVNKAFSNMLGYSQEELQNKRWQDITHPDDVELTQKEMDAFFAGKKKAARFTKRFLRKDGVIVWADISSSLRRDKEGKPLYFMTTIIDITEQKRAEEEKYRLSERYSNLLSSVPEIIMEVNNKKVYTWANPAGYEFFGDDVIGKTAAYYFEGKQDTYDIVEPLFTGDENNFYVESWQRRKDGLKRLLAWWCRALKDEKGNVLGALSSAQDITERKQADEVLRKSEERYHSLFENMLNGFAYCQMIYDGKRPVDFIYLDVNRAFESLTGLKNAVGKKVSELIPGIRESDPQLLNIYSRAALTGKPEVFESYVEALKMWFSISVYSPQKKYFVAIFDVITKRKAAEEALQKSNILLDSIMNQSPNAMWISDKSGTLLRINPACCELLNITEDEVVGKYNVFNDNIVQEQGLMPLIKSVFDKGKPVKFEITYDTAQLK
ncbi:PAS domain S-box protein, partial [bacterium]|nr:PAS domain S-box protein [bacterium]